MANMVKVSLLHPQGLNLDGAVIRYKKGIQEMPYEHAQMMGLTRRIVTVDESQVPDETVARPALPFGGMFDEKLIVILQEGGFKTLGEVANANDDQLRAVKGIGPANYEIIQTALGRRAPVETEGE